MRSDPVVVIGMEFQNSAQMCRAQDNDVVQTLAPDRVFPFFAVVPFEFLPTKSPGRSGCVGTIGGSGLTGASFVSGSRCPDIDGSKDVVGKD